MRYIQKRLKELENANRQEICCAFLWVRKEHEIEDEEQQKLEIKKHCKDLPSETYYQLFSYNYPCKDYTSFTQWIRKECTIEQWWKKQIIRGMPCQDYKDDWKNLKKL